MFDSFLAFFVFGGWLFWLALLALGLFAAIVSEGENYRGWLTFWTVAFVALFGAGAYSWLVSVLSFKGVLFVAVGYVAVGMVWTLVKWWLHVSKVKAQVREYDPADDRNGYKYNGFVQALTPSKNKSRITVWGVYWPLSMVWSVVHESAEAAFLSLVSWYKTIASGTVSELEKKKPAGY